MLPKLRQFLVVITGLIVAKIWHDTLPIFLDLYSTNMERSLLSTYLSCNSLGMTIGGIFAGLFTDSLTPKVVFPIGMLGIFLTTASTMLCFKWPFLRVLFANFIYSIIIYSIFIYLYEKLRNQRWGRTVLAIFFIAWLCISILKDFFSINIFKSISNIGFIFTNTALILAFIMFIMFLLEGLKPYNPNLFIKAVILKLVHFGFYLIILITLAFKDRLTLLEGANRIVNVYLSLDPMNISYLGIEKIDPNMVFLFVRGALMSISMNAAYVTVGDMYRGSSWLPVASAYLYTALFGSLASLPILIRHTSKNIFILFAFISLSLSIILRNIIPEKEIKPIDFRNYLSSLAIVARSKEFWMVCSVTMVCIGSFYNLMYIFKDASINTNLASNLIGVQSIGRYSTFVVGLISTFSGIAFFRISNQNCAQFMYYGMGFVSLGMTSLTFLLIFKKLGLFSEIIFYLICACSGISQPASKASIISVAQSLGPNITGTAQSLTTFSYSLVEFIGTTIIFRLKYPIGCITYLSLGSMLVLFLAINIYRSRNKINSYISSDP